MIYKIEKLEVKEGKRSGVVAGSRTEAKTCAIRAFNDKDEETKYIQSPKLSDIEVGDMVLVFENIYYMNKTSPITKILETTDTSIKFETGTSIYLLETEEESEEEDES